MATEIESCLMTESAGLDIADAIRQVANAVSKRNTSIVYGVHIDGNESDPSEMVTYLKDAVGMEPAKMNYSSGVFHYGSWEDAFFMPKPCMLKSDGTVDYYLNPDDYTKKADGTASDVASTSYDGNAMMEWPKVWMKIVPSPDGNSASIYIANHKADKDFHDWPYHDKNGVSNEHFYTAIYNGSVVGGKMRSISGQQVSCKTTSQQERTYAQANGSDIWDIEKKADIDLINFLLVLMGKSTDTQTVFGQGLHTNGSEAINNNFRTGVHNTKGLFYGTDSGAIADGSYGNAVKIFGMENWYGFQWRRYLGHIMVNGAQKVKLTYGKEDGSEVEGFNLTGDGYIETDTDVPTGTSGGYINKMNFTEQGVFPEAASGSASTYYCDGLWFDNGIVSVPLRGGLSRDGLHVGASCVDLYNVASISGWDVGASLSCKSLA